MLHLIHPPIRDAVADAGDLRPADAPGGGHCTVRNRLIDRAYFSYLIRGELTIPRIRRRSHRVHDETVPVRMPDVLGLRDDLEITEPVVEFVPIDVVDLQARWNQATASPPYDAVRKALKVTTAVRKTQRRVRRSYARSGAAPTRSRFRASRLDTTFVDAQPGFPHGADHITSAGRTPKHARSAYTVGKAKAN